MFELSVQPKLVFRHPAARHKNDDCEVYKDEAAKPDMHLSVDAYLTRLLNVASVANLANSRSLAA